MKYKKGNIEIILISLFVIIICVILIAMYLIYFQINTLIYSIKTDLFYICQNSFLAINKEELAYSNYEINLDVLKEKINSLLKLNYPKNDINLNNIIYDFENKKINISIKIEVSPIALRGILKNIKINMNESIKLKLMEVR